MHAPVDFHLIPLQCPLFCPLRLPTTLDFNHDGFPEVLLPLTSPSNWAGGHCGSDEKCISLLHNDAALRCSPSDHLRMFEGKLSSSTRLVRRTPRHVRTQHIAYEWLAWRHNGAHGATRTQRVRMAHTAPRAHTRSTCELRTRRHAHNIYD